MKKVLHFTHIDSDALGCDVLIKFLYSVILDGDYDVETYYIANSNVDKFISDTMNKLMSAITLNSDLLCVYDAIYVTDIGPSIDAMNSIMDYVALLKKIKKIDCSVYGFDHHVTNMLGHYFDNFIVADNLYSLYINDNKRKIEQFRSHAGFPVSYYLLSWPHDNTDIEFTSINDVDTSRSMKISATFLVYLYALSTLWETISSHESRSNALEVWDERYIKFKHMRQALDCMVKDISCYDTWEWKTNKYIDATGKEDRTSKLVDMLGIESATKVIFDNVCKMYERDDIDSSEYIPDQYTALYEYDKFKSFKYVAHSYNNVRKLEGMHIKGFFNTLCIPELYDDELDAVFLSISDNTIDIGEQSTFITSYFANYKCMFVHVFVSSRTVSFRSNLAYGVNVASIAKALGGGGHVTASGVKLNAEMISKLVIMYHINAVDLIDMDTESISYKVRLTNYALNLPELSLFDYSTSI